MTFIPHFLAGVIITGAIFALSIPETLQGQATVIDGDTIHLNDQRIRLWGIDAPERDQPCGLEATQKLRSLTTLPISCTLRDKDRYGRLVAQCFSGDKDIGREMIAAGLAIDYARYSHGYYAQVVSSTKCDFTSPEKWRAAHKH